MERKWWHKSIVYQIYPRSFYDSNGDGVGDLKGVIQKLDYLKELGIDVIWLSPVYQSPMDDNGYDISDYHAIAEEFGTMEEMEQLIEESKKREIKIIMDLVVNHTSDEHAWFMESKSGRSNPKRNWYIWKDAKDGTPPNNGRSIFGGSAWEYDEATEQYYLHVFSRKQPDLNWENAEVRQAVYKMIRWWLDKGISGFRVDAITFIKKNRDFPDILADSEDGLAPIAEVSLNQEGIHAFLSELKRNTFSHYDILTVAEAPGVHPDELPKYVGEDGHFNMLFEFDHVDLDLDKEGKWYQPKEWTLLELKSAITKSQNVYNQMGWGALYLENHDQPRSLNKFIKEEDMGVIPAKMLASFYFFLKGTPFIYQGQEIGMTNVSFPSIGDYDDIASHDQYQAAIKEGYSPEDALKAIWRRSRDNARTPMHWDDTENAGFTKGNPWLKVNRNFKTINVENGLQDPQSLLCFYKNLIRLRKDSEYSDVITYGDYQAIWEEKPDVFAYIRKYENQKILVIGNFYGMETRIALDLPVKKVIVSNYEDLPEDFNCLKMRPYESLVLELE